MIGSKNLALFLSTLLVAAVLGEGALQAQVQPLQVLVIGASGKVAYRSAADGKLVPVQVGQTRLSDGDIVLTGPDSKATLQIEGKPTQADADHPGVTTIDIGPKARVLMSKLFADLSSGAEQVQIGVAQGQVISNVRRIDPNSERFEVETPTAVAAVRGTKFLSDVRWVNRKWDVSFRVDRGRIDLFSRDGDRLASVGRGEVADIEPDGSANVGAAGAGGAAASQGASALPALGVGAAGASGPGGESSDTTNAPDVGDDEGDDVGGGHR